MAVRPPPSNSSINRLQNPRHVPRARAQISHEPSRSGGGAAHGYEESAPSPTLRDSKKKRSRITVSTRHKKRGVKGRKRGDW